MALSVRTDKSSKQGYFVSHLPIFEAGVIERQTNSCGRPPFECEDCSRGLSGIFPTVKQRPALGALFLLLAVAFAGVAFAAGNGAGGEVRRWIIALAAAVLAVWLGSMAFRAFR